MADKYIKPEIKSVIETAFAIPYELNGGICACPCWCKCGCGASKVYKERKE